MLTVLDIRIAIGHIIFFLVKIEAAHLWLSSAKIVKLLIAGEADSTK